MTMTEQHENAVLDLLEPAAQRIMDAEARVYDRDPAVARACCLEAIRKLQRAEKKLLSYYRKARK